jgi:3D (Asp-Asp-Asp) domain-containing protein
MELLAGETTIFLGIPVTVTAYTNSVRECDDSPNITASGKRVKSGYVAVSPDLEREFGCQFGVQIHLSDAGFFEVQDRTNPRYKRRVDIFMFDSNAAKEFGVKDATLQIGVTIEF